jgi:hypothetical protein
MNGILEAEVLNEWSVDPVVERQAVLMALRASEKTGVVGDFQITTSTSGSVDVIHVKVRYV